MTRFFTSLILIFVFTISAFAQKNGETTGILLGDEETPLPFATVSVYTAMDTALIDYVLTEDDGSFLIKKLPLNTTLRIIISYLGYEPVKEDFELSENGAIKDFGTIEMTSTSQTLDEILVLGERPPIMMKNDTLEFNAGSFTTRDGATVEDLIKKLPGVVVDNQGNITANGRAVTKVRVDGKDFFGGDPRIALRNLTSDMIDKVQITDDREEDPQQLLADDEVDQVINLKLKKDAKIKAFGKAYAGGGTEDRYEVGGIVNSFRDTFQLSMVGYYNNLSQTNLSMNEMLSLGSFVTNRRGYWGGGGIDGIQFGAGGSGYPTSLLGGANANATFGGAKMNLQYFYSNNTLEFGSKTFKEQTIRPDSVFFYDSQNEGNSKNQGHNVTGGLRWEIDTMTQLNFNIGLNYSHGERPSFNEETSAFNDKDNILQNFVTTEDPSSANLGLNTRVYFNKKLNDDGRNISFRSSFSKSKNDNDLFSNFERTYFQNAIDSVVYFDQLRTSYSDNQSFEVNLRYTEPIAENWFIDLEAEYEPSSRINNIETRQQYQQDPDWSLIDNLSNDFSRNEQEMELGTGIRYQKDKVQVNLSVEYDILNYTNKFGDEIPDFNENYRFFTPRLRVVLDGWRLFYRYSYNTPDISQLHPITNNTNPLYIREGNPNLTPVRSHGMYVSKFSYARKWKYRLYMSGNYRGDNIINTSRVDESGVTYSRPINFKAPSYNLRGGSGINRTFELENQKISVDFDLNANIGSGPFFINGQEGISNNTGLGGGLSVNYNFHDIIDFSPKYNLDYNHNTYEKVDYRDVNIFNHRVSGDFTLYLPWNMEFQNDLTYRYIPQTTPGFRKSSFIWHAALNKKILASKKITLRLSAYDILDQNINFYRYVNFNNIVDGQQKTLSRYLLFSVIYDFRDTGKGSRGGGRPGGGRRH
ncbi:outer membrane beta-barrel protein [Membranicola marinus]|uniref:Outer membrane beta-barrel protein n=1 Tax=Membranihabitans marinus TaxID=1227546 RepID=A0A953HWX4_9BACT|nr:outer membrane beta-barrel protein [Membranihabitans marinus]MBY5958096.1 outer membrane beta-barrel protein [Membranihabitans marinus]